MSFIESIESANSLISAMNTMMPEFTKSTGTLIDHLKGWDTSGSGNIPKELDVDTSSIISVLNKIGSSKGSGLLEGLQSPERSKLGTKEGLSDIFSDMTAKPEKQKQIAEPKAGLTMINEIFTSLAQGNTVKSAVALQGGIKGMIGGSAKMLAIQGAMAFIGGAVAPFSSIMTTIGSLGSMLGTGFQPMINDINKAIITLMPYMRDASEWMRETYTNIKSWISNLSWENIKNSIGDWYNGLKDKISESWNNGVDWLTNAKNTIKDKIADNWNNGINWLINAKNTIKDKVAESWNASLEWMTNLGVSIKDKIETSWIVVTDWFGNVGTTIKTKIETAWTTVTDWFSGIGTTIKEKIVASWTTVTDWFGGIWTEIKTTLETGFKVVLDWFAALPQKIVDSLTSAMKNVGGKISEGWDELWD